MATNFARCVCDCSLQAMLFYGLEALQDPQQSFDVPCRGPQSLGWSWGLFGGSLHAPPPKSALGREDQEEGFGEGPGGCVLGDPMHMSVLPELSKQLSTTSALWL